MGGFFFSGSTHAGGTTVDDVRDGITRPAPLSLVDVLLYRVVLVNLPAALAVRKKGNA
jgi:hypothetical protein